MGCTKPPCCCIANWGVAVPLAGPGVIVPGACGGLKFYGINEIVRSNKTEQRERTDVLFAFLVDFFQFLVEYPLILKLMIGFVKSQSGESIFDRVMGLRLNVLLQDVPC